MIKMLLFYTLIHSFSSKQDKKDFILAKLELLKDNITKLNILVKEDTFCISSQSIEIEIPEENTVLFHQEISKHKFNICLPYSSSFKNKVKC